MTKTIKLKDTPTGPAELHVTAEVADKHTLSGNLMPGKKVVRDSYRVTYAGKSVATHCAVGNMPTAINGCAKFAGTAALMILLSDDRAAEIAAEVSEFLAACETEATRATRAAEDAAINAEITYQDDHDRILRAMAE